MYTGICIAYVWETLDIVQLLHTLRSHKHTFADMLIHPNGILKSCIDVASAVQHSWWVIFILQTYAQSLPPNHPTLFSHCVVKGHSRCWSYHWERVSRSVRLAPLARWCVVGSKLSNKNSLEIQSEELLVPVWSDNTLLGMWRRCNLDRGWRSLSSWASEQNKEIVGGNNTLGRSDESLYGWQTGVKNTG